MKYQILTQVMLFNYTLSHVLMSHNQQHNCPAQLA